MEQLGLSDKVWLGRGVDSEKSEGNQGQVLDGGQYWAKWWRNRINQKAIE